jgi:hypothetical protein
MTKSALKLVDGDGNLVTGADFALSPEQAIAFCSTWNEDEWIRDQLDRLWAEYERNKDVFGFRCGIVNGVRFIGRSNLSEAWCRWPSGAEGQWQDTEVTDALREALVSNMQINISAEAFDAIRSAGLESYLTPPKGARQRGDGSWDVEWDEKSIEKMERSRLPGEGFSGVILRYIAAFHRAYARGQITFDGRPNPTTVH